MDCLYAKCVINFNFQISHISCINFLIGIPYVTDCVMAELEKLGSKYRVALRIVKDPRFERLPCLHKGTYADDCIVQRIKEVNKFNFVSLKPDFFVKSYAKKKNYKKNNMKLKHKKAVI